MRKYVHFQGKEFTRNYVYTKINIVIAKTNR